MSEQQQSHVDKIEEATPEDLSALRSVLLNESGKVPLAQRFRALFHLKSMGIPSSKGAEEAIDIISDCFRDDSELLKHELAYCLGQTKNLYAADILQIVLQDNNQQCMVRHEAAEALGALGDKDSLDLLKHYFENDPMEEIRQTCELAIARIEWENSDKSSKEVLQKSLYESIDPAPPLPSEGNDKIIKLQTVLNDTKAPLFERYRAMFRLRDIGTDEAVLALASGFADDSALFKHEIAYIFGQMCSPASIPALIKMLKDESQAGMVRHEAAEALGSIATDEVLPILKTFLNDSDPVVRESAIVALDMYEYENSNQLDFTIDVADVENDHDHETTLASTVAV